LTTTDFIALAAVAITALGLVVNFLSAQAAAQSQARFQGQVQKQLEELKEGYALAREQRSFLVPILLDELQSVETWFKQGFRLAQDFIHLNEQAMFNDQDWWQDLCKRSFEAEDDWRKSYWDCYSMILRHEPTANPYRTKARNLGELFDRLGEQQKPELAPLAEQMATMLIQVSGDLDMSPAITDRLRKETEELFLKASSVITRLRLDLMDS
jgi:hypothetical protein